MENDTHKTASSTPTSPTSSASEREKVTTQAGQRILVIDSGIGGLSVCQSIAARLPEVTIHYVLDNAHFPYGNKPEAFIQQRLADLINQFQAQVSVPDLVVIACNTASTTVLPCLRAQYTQPIVGVVPAIKPACEMSQTQHVVLLATSGTATRPYTHALVSEFAGDCTVTIRGCDALVTLAEAHMAGTAPTAAAMKDALGDVSTLGDADVIVLGCTHFPFLTEALRPHFSADARFIHSGDAIARRVESLLTTMSGDQHEKDSTNACNPNEMTHSATNTAYFTHADNTTCAKTLSTHGFTVSEHVLYCDTLSAESLPDAPVS